MPSVTESPWLRRFAAVLVTVLSLAAVTTLAAKPADARVFVSVGVGVPGWGYYYPGYWHRPYWRPYWHRPYWRPYWRPYYGAYYPGWRRHRWCYWHAYRCHW
jgi:hypothetical protein